MGIFIKENLKLHFLVYFQNRKIPCDKLISFINIGEICFWFSFLFTDMPFSEENEFLKQTFFSNCKNGLFYYMTILFMLVFIKVSSDNVRLHIMHFSTNFMFSKWQIRKGNLYLESYKEKIIEWVFCIMCMIVYEGHLQKI